MKSKKAEARLKPTQASSPPLPKLTCTSLPIHPLNVPSSSAGPSTDIETDIYDCRSLLDDMALPDVEPFDDIVNDNEVSSDPQPHHENDSDLGE